MEPGGIRLRAHAYISWLAQGLSESVSTSDIEIFFQELHVADCWGSSGNGGRFLGIESNL